MFDQISKYFLTMGKFFAALILLFFNFDLLHAQDTPVHNHFRFIEIKGLSGNHLYSGESLKEALASGYGAVLVKYGWQSYNPEGWQNMYVYPAYGLGWYSGFIGNPELLGEPSAVYGFISLPLFRHHRHQMLIEPAFGLSYDLKPYHAGNNSANDAISTRFNVYFNLNIGAKYRMNREIDLMYGFDFTHFSNGRTFKPNRGLNMFGPNLGIRYHYNSKQNKVDNAYQPQTILDVRPTLSVYRASEPIREGKVLLYGAGGIVQNDKDKGTSRQHSTYTALLEYQYLLNTKNAFTIGFNLFYDHSLVEQFPDENFGFYGIHGGYDFMFWKMSIRIQGGTYFRKGREFKGDFFFRPALKYDINKFLYAQLGLKTMAGPKADWVEYGLGVKLPRIKLF
jgi:hypothetical protein